jgi:hypothetical protein
MAHGGRWIYTPRSLVEVGFSLWKSCMQFNCYHCSTCITYVPEGGSNMLNQAMNFVLSYGVWWHINT